MTPTTTSADARAHLIAELRRMADQCTHSPELGPSDSVIPNVCTGDLYDILTEAANLLATPPAVDAPGAVEALRAIAASLARYERHEIGALEFSLDVSSSLDFAALARPQAAQGREDCSHENMQASFAESRWVCRDCGRNFASWSDAMQERTTPPKPEGASTYCKTCDQLGAYGTPAAAQASDTELMPDGHIDRLVEAIRQAPVIDESTVIDLPEASDTGRGEVETHGWSVEVTRNGERLVSIGDNWVGGSILSDNDCAVIEKAARHLLGFLGTPEDSAGKDGERA